MWLFENLAALNYIHSVFTCMLEKKYSVISKMFNLTSLTFDTWQLVNNLKNGGSVLGSLVEKFMSLLKIEYKHISHYIFCLLKFETTQSLATV